MSILWGILRHFGKNKHVDNSWNLEVLGSQHLSHSGEDMLRVRDLLLEPVPHAAGRRLRQLGAEVAQAQLEAGHVVEHPDVLVTRGHHPPRFLKRL